MQTTCLQQQYGSRPAININATFPLLTDIELEMDQRQPAGQVRQQNMRLIEAFQAGAVQRKKKLSQSIQILLELGPDLDGVIRGWMWMDAYKYGWIGNGRDPLDDRHHSSSTSTTTRRAPAHVIYPITRAYEYLRATPPPSFRDLPPSAFNDQFTAADFIASSENTRDTPATVEPPTKKRRIETSFKDKTDTEVWTLSDQEIIEKQFAKCTSGTWKHYSITVKRHGGVITFVFQCKQNNPKHPKYTRDRSKMKQGSSNLGEAAKKCEGAMEQPTANTVVVPYNEARHRAICAIRSSQEADGTGNLSEHSRLHVG
ncbi:hypothetical protein B0H19DRAFT_1243754 [Mycena capillaripes]|nr:hypothetical protein B0H19DRAFT_1243754 [Mycena capillaripes]